jgi:hypothetical protein
MATDKLGPCTCCGKAARWSIVLAVGANNKPDETERYYVPNQGVRQFIGTDTDVSKAVPFCPSCMRSIEDNLRATILYMQAENGRLSIKSAT